MTNGSTDNNDTNPPRNFEAGNKVSVSECGSSNNSQNNSNSNNDTTTMRQRHVVTKHRQSLLKIHDEITTGLSERHQVPDPRPSESGGAIDLTAPSESGGAPEGWVERHVQTVQQAFQQKRSCKDWITTLIPLARWLQTYQWKESILTDILAGLTVGVMIVPQSMSYAKLAGLPVEYGLYSSLVPIFAYALFGSSRQLAVGPVALVSLLLNTGLTMILEKEGITPESTPDYEKIYTTLALQTSFLCGLCFVVMGLLRLGFVTIFLSHAVVSGFTSAAAIIIGLSQIKYIFGYSIPSDKSLHRMLENIFASIDEFNYKTFLLGTFCVMTLMGLKKLAQVYPKLKWTRAIGPLLVTVITIILQVTVDLQANGIPIVGHIPKGFPEFTANIVFPLQDMGNIAIVVLSIVIIGFMESIAIAKQLANKNNYELDSSLELVGLGMANMASGMFGGYPVVGSFSRSAVNNEAGARSGISAIVTATLVGLVLLFMTPVFEKLPLAVLASIVISGVISLVDYPEAIYLWKVHKFDFGVWMFAFLGTLFLGVELGLGIAVGISLLLVIFESAYPHTSILGRLPGTHQYRNIKQYPRAERYDGIVMVRIDAPIYFANTQNVREKIQKYYERAQEGLTLREGGNNRDQSQRSQHHGTGSKVKFIILEMSPVSHVDTSALHILAEMNANYKKTRHIQLCLANPNRAVMHRLVLSGLADEIGRDHIFVSLHDAVEHCLLEMDQSETTESRPCENTELDDLMHDMEPSAKTATKLPYVASHNTIQDFTDDRIGGDLESSRTPPGQKDADSEEFDDDGDDDDEVLQV